MKDGLSYTKWMLLCAYLINRISMKYYSIILFISLNVNCAIGQYLIKGKVFDEETNEGIPFATVYVNGTTNGVVTDGIGWYQLMVKQFPVELIMRHLNYENKEVIIEKPIAEDLNFPTTSKVMDLAEVKVADRNQRAANLKEFSIDFLGKDEWGRSALILNEEVIQFSRDYEFQTKEASVSDSSVDHPKNTTTKVTDISAINLKAKGLHTIIIDQPETGYKINVDLVSFITEYPDSNRQVPRQSYLGYYFFEPYQGSDRQQKQFEKKRAKAFHNSSLHFLRSLYRGQLAQQGFRLMEQVVNPKTQRSEFVDFDIEPYITHQSEEGIIEIVGLKDKILSILYYSKNKKNDPLDLTKKRDYRFERSLVQFLEDRCQVRSNGTIPGLSIVFGGTIAEKKVGAMVPNDFEVGNVP